MSWQVAAVVMVSLVCVTVLLFQGRAQRKQVVAEDGELRQKLDNLERQVKALNMRGL